jgi:hypothetical protein
MLKIDKIMQSELINDDILNNVIDNIIDEIVDDVIDNIIDKIIKKNEISNIIHEIVDNIIDNIIDEINKKNIISPKLKETKIQCNTIRINNNISCNYNSSQRYNYARYIPYYMRYFDPNSGYTSYVDTLTSGSEYGECLRIQLVAGNIQMFGLEEIFVLFVPNVTIKDPILIKEIDNRRNEFISFCLNIEKSYIFYNKGKTTCNNIKVVWGDKTPFNLNSFFVYPSNPSIIYASYVPLLQLDQSIIYSLSVNFFKSFENNVNKINTATILKIVYGLPYTQNEITPTNFFKTINYTYILLSYLFGTSEKLLLGLETGLSKLFIETFFTKERQLYYYNLYFSWILSRIEYKGFKSRINSSNGSN